MAQGRGLTSLNSRYSSAVQDWRSFLRAVSSPSGSIRLHQLPDWPVAVLTLSQPDKANAMSPRMMVQLHDIVEGLAMVHTTRASDALDRHVREDMVDVAKGEKEAAIHWPWAEIRGLVVRGHGGTFCSGADLRADGALYGEAGGAAMCGLMTHTLTSLQRLPCLTCALVTGAAVGGGAELLTATDFRVWDPSAKARFIHVQRAMTPGWGGARRLVELVGKRHALRCLASAMRVDAQAAMQIGLADHVLFEPSTSAFDLFQGGKAEADEETKQAYKTEQAVTQFLLPLLQVSRGMRGPEVSVSTLQDIKRAVLLACDDVEPEPASPAAGDRDRDVSWGRDLSREGKLFLSRWAGDEHRAYRDGLRGARESR